MGYKLGRNAKLYRNTGTWASPTWVVIGNVRDLTLNLEEEEADASTRATAANGFRATVPVIKNASVEFDMVLDDNDAGFTAIKNTWKNSALLDMAVMDGDITTAGSQGLRAEMSVFNFSRNEALGDVQTVNVSVKPGYSNNAAVWLEI